MNDGEAILLLTEALERHYGAPVRALDVRYLMLQGCQQEAFPEEIREVLDPQRHDPSTIVGLLDWLRGQGWLKQNGSAWSLTRQGEMRAHTLRYYTDNTGLELQQLAARLAA